MALDAVQSVYLWKWVLALLQILRYMTYEWSVSIYKALIKMLLYGDLRQSTDFEVGQLKSNTFPF
jgi:hypothetical protein